MTSSLGSDETEAAANTIPHSQRLLAKLLDKLLADDDENGHQPPATSRTDATFTAELHDILLDEGLGSSGESIDGAGVAQINTAFDTWELARQRSDERREFATVERFILGEQTRGQEERRTVRARQAREELQMAADIAQLTAFRQRQHEDKGVTDLQNRLNDAERGYLRRKATVTKAAQTATAECRSQFVRARAFFEALHRSRQAALRRAYERALRVMGLKHALCANTLDPRVSALERQSAERMFRKKEANLNELHMAQNLEEAAYLEGMFELLDKVQLAKEQAATDLFRLQVEDLKFLDVVERKMDARLNELRAEAALEMARMVAHYVGEQGQNDEDDQRRRQGVATTERRKEFAAHPGTALASVSELYDTIIWSVATSRMGLSMTGSSIYTDAFSEAGETEKETADMEVGGERETSSPDLDESDPEFLMGQQFQDIDGWKKANHNEQKGGNEARAHEDSSVVSGFTNNTAPTEDDDSLSILGKIHVIQLSKNMKAKETALLKEHAAHTKQERRRYRQTSRELKLKHQRNVNVLLQHCVEERHRLREEISQRLTVLAKSQELSTQTLQESIELDVNAMRGAWAEHKRLEDAEKKSFDKAQALISAQVFHEVRNALSSVIAMSEMASSLQEDGQTTASDLVASVNEMLQSNEEVVRYSLTMLNNILDINKIKTGSFEIQRQEFDLADLMQRATAMQLVKAQVRGVSMRFEPPEGGLCVAFTDKDIVLRIVTNFISNAVKFTSSGAIQPFILPVETIMPTSVVDSLRNMQISDSDSTSSQERHHFKLMAVGVADTGCGLSQEMLNKAEAGLYNSDNSQGTSSGAKNSGFGLHLAIQLAGTLGTKIYLADLAKCHTVLNGDVQVAFERRSNEGDRSSAFGTVLFVVIPVFMDGVGHCFNDGHSVPSLLVDASSQVDTDDNHVACLPKSSLYKFSPRCATSGSTTTDCFRILLADDVLMLRKGLARSILQIFESNTHCPVLVYTACTAEDALRMMSRTAFDLVISDNQFAPPTGLRLLEENTTRPHIRYEGESKQLLQQLSSVFFRLESFTIEEGDGELSGLQALRRVLDPSSSSEQRQTYPHPTPILILLSGHKFELPASCGMIVAQKPLRRQDIVPLLEAHAQRLIDSGVCVEEKDESGSKYRVVNQRGVQIFCRNIDA